MSYKSSSIRQKNEYASTRRIELALGIPNFTAKILYRNIEIHLNITQRVQKFKSLNKEKRDDDACITFLAFSYIEQDIKLILFSDETIFHTNGYVNKNTSINGV